MLAGVIRWCVSTQWQGQTLSRSRVDGFDMAGQHVERLFTIDIDEPCELGGSNRHPNPQEHLIAALNACMDLWPMESIGRSMDEDPEPSSST